MAVSTASYPRKRASSKQEFNLAMGMLITLKATQGTLLLDIDEKNWCQIRLSDASGQVELGADDINVIAARLTQALGNGHFKSCGEIKGRPVAWVMSLFEQHSTLYIGAKSNTVDLFFQDSGGKLIAKMSLSDGERQEWHSQLADFN